MTSPSYPISQDDQCTVKRKKNRSIRYIYICIYINYIHRQDLTTFDIVFIIAGFWSATQNNYQYIYIYYIVVCIYIQWLEATLMEFQTFHLCKSTRLLRVNLCKSTPCRRNPRKLKTRCVFVEGYVVLHVLLIFYLFVWGDVDVLTFFSGTT